MVDGTMVEKAGTCLEGTDERRLEVPASVVVFVGEEKPQKNRGGGGGGEGEGCSTKAAKKNKKKARVVECRICQEEDEVSSMESPCACNGTLKPQVFLTILEWTGLCSALKLLFLVFELWETIDFFTCIPDDYRRMNEIKIG